MANSFHYTLRETIHEHLAAGEKVNLKRPVHVTNESTTDSFDIIGVYRHPLLGSARCFNTCNHFYFLHELTEEQCEEVLRAM